MFRHFFDCMPIPAFHFSSSSHQEKLPTSRLRLNHAQVSLLWHRPQRVADCPSASSLRSPRLIYSTEGESALRWTTRRVDPFLSASSSALSAHRRIKAKENEIRVSLSGCSAVPARILSGKPGSSLPVSAAPSYLLASLACNRMSATRLPAAIWLPLRRGLQLPRFCPRVMVSFHHHEAHTAALKLSWCDDT